MITDNVLDWFWNRFWSENSSMQSTICSNWVMLKISICWNRVLSLLDSIVVSIPACQLTPERGRPGFNSPSGRTFSLPLRFFFIHFLFFETPALRRSKYFIHTFTKNYHYEANLFPCGFQPNALNPSANRVLVNFTVLLVSTVSYVVTAVLALTEIISSILGGNNFRPFQYPQPIKVITFWQYNWHQPPILLATFLLRVPIRSYQYFYIVVRWVLKLST